MKVTVTKQHVLDAVNSGEEELWTRSCALARAISDAAGQEARVSFREVELPADSENWIELPEETVVLRRRVDDARLQKIFGRPATDDFSDFVSLEFEL